MCSLHHVLLAFWDEVIVMLVKDRVGQAGSGLRVWVDLVIESVVVVG